MSMYATKDAFDLYVYYLALKRHFTSNYDFIKYNGKIKASVQSFETRNDKFQFYKLSKKSHAKDLILANMIDNPSIWVGDLLSPIAEERYLAREKIQQTLSYHFKTQLSELDSDFNSNFQVLDGQHPLLLKLYSSKKISIETLIILDSLTRCFAIWQGKIQDTIIFPQVKLKLEKVKPFISFDRDKMKKIVLEKFSN